MNTFICPVCNSPLSVCEKAYKCKNGHNFDIAKSGYVNLLLSQKSKDKRHGDDKVMVNSRREFLDKGYYKHLLNGIITNVSKYCTKDSSILDAGCGEGWYTVNLYENLCAVNSAPDILAVDISKSALDGFAKRNKNIQRAVASVYSLPVQENSCDIVLNVFAPIAEKEFHRVLKKGGILICVIALKEHLYSLKTAVYNSPRKNEIGDLNLNGFDLISKTDIYKEITITSNEDIKTLFKMTPYYYKTSKEDYEKLENLNTLTTETHFGILVYKNGE